MTGSRGARVSPAANAWGRALLIAFALAGLACASKPAPAPPAPVTVVAPEGEQARSAEPSRRDPVFLWEARVGSATLYLLGSVHVARAELYPLDPRIEAAFAQSRALVLELSLDETAQLDAARRMMEAARLPPGVRLREVIQPSTWELLVATVERRGGTLFGLRGFRPWFVALGLTTQALEQEGFSAEHGIDEHFRRRASGRMPIIALETVDQQLRLFSELAPETQEMLLKQTLEELDQYGSDLQITFDAWQRGDSAALDELLVSPMRKEYPVLFARLFSDRNRAMTERLLELAAGGGRYFVIVGAGHLVGDDGIVDLFRARGIVPTQH